MKVSKIVEEIFWYTNQRLYDLEVTITGDILINLNWNKCIYGS